VCAALSGIIGSFQRAGLELAQPFFVARDKRPAIVGSRDRYSDEPSRDDPAAIIDALITAARGRGSPGRGPRAEHSLIAGAAQGAAFRHQPTEAISEWETPTHVLHPTAKRRSTQELQAHR